MDARAAWPALRYLLDRLRHEPPLAPELR